MWLVYTTEYYSAIKKRQSNTICSNMVGSRDSHIKWSKPERKRQVPYDSKEKDKYHSTYLWNLKYGTDDPFQTNKKQKTNKQENRNRSWPRRAGLGFPGEKGKGVGCTGLLGVFGIQTVIFGMDGHWGSTVQHGEMCVIGSFCCTTEFDETL